MEQVMGEELRPTTAKLTGERTLALYQKVDVFI